MPIGYEGTTTYQKGCASGPDAIIEASQQVEMFDEQLTGEFYQAGIYTHPAIDFMEADTPEQAQERIFNAADPLFQAGQCVISLGGEHSITAGLVRAAQRKWPDLCVLHFDAHADLRASYHDSLYNHACVMRRVFDMGVPFVSVGIRSYCRDQHEFITANAIGLIPPRRVYQDLSGVINEVLGRLGEHVYITFDIDALDPAFAPGTGTPEPGGLNYFDVLAILEQVGRTKTMVGGDMVEVMPLADTQITEFTAARLVYKMIAYSQLRRD